MSLTSPTAKIMNPFAMSNGGVRTVDPSIAYLSNPILVPENYATLQDAFDAGVVGQTWASSDALTGTMSCTTGSEIITGVGTSFLSEVATDNLLVLDGENYMVRDVASNTSLRLWSGASKVSNGETGTIKQHTGVTILTSSDDNALAGIVPDGVSLQIVGTDISNRWTAVIATTFVIEDLANIEIHNMSLHTVAGAAALILSDNWGVGGTSRSVLRLTQLQCMSEGQWAFVLFQGSAAIIADVTAKKIKCNFICDYLTMDNVSTQNAIDDDVILMAIPSARTTMDIAYPHEVTNFIITKTDGGGDNFNGGLEWNQWAASKVANVRDSVIINTNVAAVASPSHPVFTPTVGTVNFYDSIIDSDSGTVEEIKGRGATINFNSSTTKLDGSTPPRIG
jgi:hypothetical protein